jgi:hypothetical protein
MIFSKAFLTSHLRMGAMGGSEIVGGEVCRKVGLKLGL